MLGSRVGLSILLNRVLGGIGVVAVPTISIIESILTYILLFECETILVSTLSTHLHVPRNSSRAIGVLKLAGFEEGTIWHCRRITST